MKKFIASVRQWWWHKRRHKRYDINVQPAEAVRNKPYTFLLPTAYDILSQQGRKPLSLRDVRAVMVRSKNWSERDLQEARNAIATWKDLKERNMLGDVHLNAAQEAALFYSASVVVAAAAMERAGVARPLAPTPRQLDQLVGALGPSWPLRPRTTANGRTVPLREVPDELKALDKVQRLQPPRKEAPDKPLPKGKEEALPQKPKSFWGKVWDVVTYVPKQIWRFLKWLWFKLMELFKKFPKLFKFKSKQKGDQKSDQQGKAEKQDSNDQPPPDQQPEGGNDGQAPDDTTPEQNGENGENPENGNTEPAPAGDGKAEEAAALNDDEKVPDEGTELTPEEKELFDDFLEEIRKQDPKFWEEIERRKVKQRELREAAEAEKQHKKQMAEEARKKAEDAAKKAEQALQDVEVLLGDETVEVGRDDQPNYDSHGGIYADLDPKLVAGIPPKVIRNIEVRLERLLKAMVYDPEGMGETPRMNPRKLTREIVSRRFNMSRVRREEMAQPMVILAADVSGSCSAVCKVIVAVTGALLRADPSLLLVIHSNGDPEKVYGQMAGELPAIGSMEHPDWWRSVLEACAPVAGFINFGDSDALWLMRQISETSVDLVWLDHGARYSGSEIRQLEKAEYNELEKHGVVPLLCCANVRDAVSTSRALGIALERGALRERRRKLQQHRKRRK